MQPAATPTVTVVGAGMVGVCCALELQRRGYKVKLVDRKAPGQETSWGNAGVLARSSLIPFNNPGLWASLPRLLGNRTPQFRYDLRFVLRRLPWALGFLGRARTGPFLETAAALDALIRASLPEHMRLLRETHASQRLRQDGWIFLYRSNAAYTQSELTRATLERFEVSTQVLNANALAMLEPDLRPIFPRALWVKDAYSVDNPGAVLQAYAELFRARGGEVELNEIAALLPRNPAGWQLTDMQGHSTVAQQVVLALGPWSNDLLQTVNLKVPLAYERGYHQHFVAGPGSRLSRPVYDTGGGYVLAPMQTGLRLTTGVELTERDAPPNSAQLTLAEYAARQALALGPRVGDTWLGSRPTLPDSRPLIGRAPGHPGLWLALGHQHIGFSTGPGSALLLADLMTQTVGELDPRPFRPERFLA